MNSNTIILGFIFGCIGMGYFVYGKKQARWVALFAGVGLCAFPYVITNIWAVLLTGVVLMALPFIFKA